MGGGRGGRSGLSARSARSGRSGRSGRLGRLGRSGRSGRLASPNGGRCSGLPAYGPGAWRAGLSAELSPDRSPGLSLKALGKPGRSGGGLLPGTKAAPPGEPGEPGGLGEPGGPSGPGSASGALCAESLHDKPRSSAACSRSKSGMRRFWAGEAAWTDAGSPCVESMEPAESAGPVWPGVPDRAVGAEAAPRADKRLASTVTNWSRRSTSRACR